MSDTNIKTKCSAYNKTHTYVPSWTFIVKSKLWNLIPPKLIQAFSWISDLPETKILQICNADYEIISVDASCHGSATNDSHIWSNHPLKLHLEEFTRNQSVWLLGMYNFTFV